MRIISQDGCCDIPYEQAVVAHLDRTVVAYPLNDLGSSDYIQLASYSTEEKAIRAMEMCRKQYSQCEFNKLVIPKTDENLAKVSISLTGNVINQIAEKYVFQFPADDEI
jgi:hypothetical protein